MLTYVYGLFDPAEPDHCRYIGKTTDPERRMYGIGGHLHSACVHDTHKARWLRAVLDSGRQPELRVLAELESEKHALVLEGVLIAAYRRLGHQLTNATPGGDSGPLAGWHHTEETLEKMRRAQAGHPVSAEQRAAISAANRGRRPSPEVYLRRVEGVRRYWASARKGEHSARCVASWTPERYKAHSERMQRWWDERRQRRNICPS